ncbi:MAG: energy-coupled thiamine transporter ThiT [Christensenellales bacterium]
MANFVLSAGFTNYFNFDSDRGIILSVALILLAALIVAGVVIGLVRKEYFKTFSLVALATVLAYAVAIAIYFIVQTSKDGEYSQKYQALLIGVFAVAVLAIVIIAVMVDRKSDRPGKEQTLSVVYAAICVAMAFGLSYVRVFKAPYGGSITLASLLPIALYSYMFGPKKGVVCGLVYGILQAVQDPWIVHPIQFLLDYPLAFAMVGLLAGILREKLKTLPAFALGVVIAIVARYLCHLISGAVYFGEYAADYGFSNPWVYSLAYNALYVFPDGAITLACGCALLASKAMNNQIFGVMNKANTLPELYKVDECVNVVEEQ